LNSAKRWIIWPAARVRLLYVGASSGALPDLRARFRHELRHWIMHLPRSNFASPHVIAELNARRYRFAGAVADWTFRLRSHHVYGARKRGAAKSGKR
jgi:hypothetical protein